MANGDLHNELTDLQMRGNQLTNETLESTRRIKDCLDIQDAGVKTLVKLDEQGEQLDCENRVSSGQPVARAKDDRTEDEDRVGGGYIKRIREDEMEEKLTQLGEKVSNLKSNLENLCNEIKAEANKGRSDATNTRAGKFQKS